MGFIMADDKEKYRQWNQEVNTEEQELYPSTGIDDGVTSVNGVRDLICFRLIVV
jgi:hypothetical protein